MAASPLVDSEAARKIEAAAGAVGLSTEDLVSLVSDSGLLAAKPPDEITEVLTLKDLGARLHNLSCTKSRGERASWFRGLVPTQQQALLTVLRERGYATATIAQEYDLDPMAVVAAHNKFADQLGKNVINIRLSTLAGHMMLAAERAQQGAMEASDWSTFWRIQKEVVGLLQSMGIVERAAQKIEVDSHISVGVEEKQAELDKILRLAAQGERRRLEITLSRENQDEEDRISVDAPEVGITDDAGLPEVGRRQSGEGGSPRTSGGDGGTPGVVPAGPGSPG